jgi:hypothetical protein
MVKLQGFNMEIYRRIIEKISTVAYANCTSFSHVFLRLIIFYLILGSGFQTQLEKAQKMKRI